MFTIAQINYASSLNFIVYTFLVLIITAHKVNSVGCLRKYCFDRTDLIELICYSDKLFLTSTEQYILRCLLYLFRKSAHNN